MSIWVSAMIAYFLGSIPFGLIAGHLVRGIDIRNYGSQNVGATNVYRVVGKKWGLLVFSLDAAKGLIAVILGGYLLKYTPEMNEKLLLGAMAIVGHSFPLWLGFRGGKGVATSLGVFLAIVWLPTVITFSIWLIALFSTRYVSVASLTAALAFPVVVTLLHRSDRDFYWILVVSLILTIFIFYTHRKNLQRLTQGRENRFF